MTLSSFEPNTRNTRFNSEYQLLSLIRGRLKHLVLKPWLLYKLNVDTKWGFSQASSFSLLYVTSAKVWIRSDLGNLSLFC